MGNLGLDNIKHEKTVLLRRITDWQLYTENNHHWYYIDGQPMQINKDTDPVIIKYSTKLLELANAEENKKLLDFRVFLEGLNFRVHRIIGIYGECLMLRRMPEMLMPLNELGFHKGIVEAMVHGRLSSGGLVAICGETGHGKSTTTAALIAERLKRFGSFCLTIEDPIEMPLHGRHGDGHCIQTEVQKGEFANAVSGAMRAFPSGQNSMLMLGEIRDSETAVNALQVALNGHLVITTVHGRDLITGLQRLLSLAGDIIGENEARALLSMTFRLGIYQQIINKTVHSTSLQIINSKDGASGVAAIIRGQNNGGLMQLENVIAKNRALLQTRGSLLDL